MKPDRKRGQSKNPREVHPPSRSKADDPEPSAAYRHLPVGLFVALAVLLFWAMVYLDNHAGGFNPKVYQRFASSNQLISLVPYDPEMEAFNKGLGVYNRTCLGCHQPHGMGAPPNPPLAGSEWVLAKDPSRMIHIVLDGLVGPVEVKGQTFNGTMPPWRPTLNDQEMAQVISYVRKAWGNNASVVTPQQVADIRKEPRSSSWTAEELQKIPLKE
jgi:mono/diheme cytochrome c family protein